MKLLHAVKGSVQDTALRDARRAVHGVAVPADGAAGRHVRLTDADGLIAVAEPRPDGTLKPTVGFRGS